MRSSFWQSWRPPISVALVAFPAALVLALGFYSVAFALESLSHGGDGDCVPAIGQCPPKAVRPSRMWVAVAAVAIQLFFAAVALLYNRRPRPVSTVIVAFFIPFGCAAWYLALGATGLPEEESLLRSYVIVSKYANAYLAVAAFSVAVF